MRVLVTGGSGRLGRTVVADLARRGHQVVAVDRVEEPPFSPTGSSPRSGGRTARAGSPARAVTADPPVERPATVTADLAAAGAIAAVFEQVRPEAVIHLAAVPVPFVRPDHETYTTNTGMAFGVCDAAVAVGARMVVLAASPTVMGYGDPSWTPRYLPLDEAHPVAPQHAYALSKVATEQIAAYFATRNTGTRFAAFRPCYVIAPEEWAGAPTQGGHTVRERLEDPALAAVSLFNYCDARDVAGFLHELVTAVDDDATAAAADGRTFFVGAADALATEPLTDLVPRFHPGTAAAAPGLAGHTSVFSNQLATSVLGWRPQYSWRTELR
jgi:nucleoside-diphosphate-sugar epimerase